MKRIAVLLSMTVLLFVLAGGQAYVNNSNRTAEKPVLAYHGNIGETNIQMKPVSRGAELDREIHDSSVLLMSFNMHRGIGKDSKLNLSNTAVVIAASNADIIALQEVERFSIRTGFKDQIKYLSEELGMNYAFGKSINVLNGEYGNGLISRYPIIEYMAYELPSYSEQRTLLRTVVDIEGYKLAVYNTHLGLKEAERKEQLDFILELTSQESLDYVLMGDMNSKITKLAVLTEVLKDAADGSDKVEQNTFEDEDASARIDYIFTSSSLKTANYDVVQTQVSDHYPIISEIIVSE